MFLPPAFVLTKGVGAFLIGAMKYEISKIRRKDRALDEPSTLEILLSAEYGVLSLADMSASDGAPAAYGVPLDFVFDGSRGCIYFHCAKAGRKLDCLRNSPLASFCVVGKTRILPEKFSTEYESVIAECRAVVVSDARERAEALEMLVRKYSPEHVQKGLEYIAAAAERTEVVRLEILEFSGKSRRGRAV